MNHIVIGSDHAGFKCKELIKAMLESAGYTVEDKGTLSEDSVDYPDFAHKVAEAVLTENNTTGILCCGSGNGVAMAANKHQGIRAALCWNMEIASLAIKHNAANVLCIPARFVTTDEAYQITNAFLNEKFEGGRHQNRVNKIDCISDL